MRRYLKPLCHTVLALAISTSLAACGGGGGDSAGDNNESRFVPVANDGVVVSSSPPIYLGSGTSVNLGDGADDIGARILLRFPMPALPVGANVVGARLHLRTGARANLTSNELGRMRFVRIDAGASVGNNDFGSAELAHDADADFLVSPEDFDLVTGALALYQSAVAAADSTLDVRIQYENLTDTDGVQDTLQFVMSEHATLEGPRLEVIYELP